MSCRCVPADALAVPLSLRARAFFRISCPAFRPSQYIPSGRVGGVMRLALIILALLYTFGGASSAQTNRASNSAARPRVVELRIGDEIEPIMAEYIDGGIRDAAQQGASLILITMDTPGGLSSSMEEIIQHILSSPVPVVVHVSPAGARGASAGFFILLSADVAAMAPGTHAGAASPLIAVGGIPLNVDETLKKKILNDATAFLRSYAGKRGRNALEPE